MILALNLDLILLRKFCGDNSIRFTTATPKYQEQNVLVERHWGTITKMANTMLLHARLNKKFFFYAVKYAQRVHDVIPVKDSVDNQGFQPLLITYSQDQNLM